MDEFYTGDEFVKRTTIAPGLACPKTERLRSSDEQLWERCYRSIRDWKNKTGLLVQLIGDYDLWIVVRPSRERLQIGRLKREDFLGETLTENCWLSYLYAQHDGKIILDKTHVTFDTRKNRATSWYITLLQLSILSWKWEIVGYWRQNLFPKSATLELVLGSNQRVCSRVYLLPPTKRINARIARTNGKVTVEQTAK